MAAKRLASSTINWSELAKQVPDAQKMAFSAIKSKQDGYIRAIGSLPEKMPALEWEKYQGRIDPKLVDEFKKKYQALDIPYPKDTLTDKIKAQATEQKSAYETFLKDSKARIVNFNTELAKWEAMIPVSEMNKEEAMQAVPHLVPEHRPGKVEFWPFEYEHDPEERKRLKEEYNRTYWDH